MTRQAGMSSGKRDDRQGVVHHAVFNDCFVSQRTSFPLTRVKSRADVGALK